VDYMNCSLPHPRENELSLRFFSPGSFVSSMFPRVAFPLCGRKIFLVAFGGGIWRDLRLLSPVWVVVCESFASVHLALPTFSSRFPFQTVETSGPSSVLREAIRSPGL